MKQFIEKWYVLFMLMRIARHNQMRMRFAEKYSDVFYDYGQNLESMTLEKYHEENGKLYKQDKKDGVKRRVAVRPQKDDFGLYEYVNQRCGYCEDDYYGIIYTKTPIRNIWIVRSYHC